MSLNIGAAEVKISASVSGQQQVDQLAAALGRVGSAGQVSAQQTAAAFRMLPAQLTDIATQLAGGQSPFLILLQQGGQVKDAFGGLGATFRAFASVLTPARVAIGGLATAALIIGKAFYDGKQEIADFNRLVALTGNSAGLTMKSLLEMSSAVEKGSRQTIGGAKDIVSALFGTGAFSADAIQPVAEAIAKLKDVSGQSADELAKKFAGSLMNTSGLAADLNKQIGYLTISQLKYIQSLESAGKYEEAMIYNANILKETLEKRRVELGFIEKSWDGVTKAASSFWNVMTGIARGTDLSSLGGQISALETRLEKLKSTGFGPNSSKVTEIEQALTSKRAELANITREAEAEKAKVTREKVDTALSAEALQRHALMSKTTADEVIASIQREQYEVSAAREKGLISEQEYTRRTAENRRRELDAEIALGRTRKDLAAQEPAKDEVAVAQRARKILEIEAQVAALQREKQNLEAETALKVGTSDFLQNRAVRNYAQDLQFQNQMIAIQGQEVRMTAFEYQELVKQKQFEQELAQKTRDMAPGEADAYREVAKALFAQRQEIERANEAKSRTAEYGAQSFLRSYADEASNAAKQTQKVMEGAFQKTEDALVNFVTTGKLSFKDLADSIMKDLVRMALKTAIMQPLANMMGGLLGGGVDYAPPIAPGLGGLYANGGAFIDGVQAFASGGIVSRPTLFPMARGAGLMGEAGPEAIMPLRRGADGKLGVAGSGGSTVVNVNVHDQNNSNVSVRQSQDANGSLNIDVLVEAAVSRSIAKNGGIAQALQNRYGLNRAGGR